MTTNKTPTVKTAYVSLELLTSPEFQLKLLEGATKGKKVFDTFWDNDYTYQQKLLWDSISKEVHIWETEGNLDLLIYRGRQLAAKLKDEGALHQQALQIYLNILEISRRKSRKENSNKPQDTLTTPVTDFNKSESSLSILTLRPDPFATGADSLQGEPSIEQSYKGEGKRSIWGSHAESLPDKSTTSYQCQIAPEPYDDCKIASDEERSRERSRYISIEIDEASQPGSVKWSKKRKENEIRISNLRSDSIGFPMVDLIDEKEDEIKFDIGRRLSVETFKGDFVKPIQWKVNNETHTASSVNEIRSKHKVLMEGPFEKRRKRRVGYRWKHYYGFLIASGVLLYFGQEKNNEIDFKKAVDFRENSMTVSKDDDLRLDVYSQGRNWLLKFAMQKEISDWHDAIKQFSRCPVKNSS